MSVEMLDKAPLQTRSLSDQLCDRITQSILSGELPPGSRISEANIAKMFGISRGPMREALYRLEGRKLVERTPNAGVKVISPSPEEMLEAYAVREALEGMAARLTAGCATARLIAKLERMVERHRKQLGDEAFIAVKEGELGDLEFHFAVIEGCGNTMLAEMLTDQLYFLMRIFSIKIGGAIGLSKAAIKEHEEVLEAIRERDGDRAERIMRRHIREASDMLQRIIEGKKEFKPPAGC